MQPVLQTVYKKQATTQFEKRTLKKKKTKAKFNFVSVPAHQLQQPAGGEKGFGV